MAFNSRHPYGDPQLDSLKIDQAFVRGDRDVAVITAIIGLGHAFGMTVVAEGVETPGQWQRLRELGCDYAQGHHLSVPLAPADVPGFLESWQRR